MRGGRGEREDLLTIIGKVEKSGGHIYYIMLTDAEIAELEACLDDELLAWSVHDESSNEDSSIDVDVVQDLHDSLSSDDDEMNQLQSFGLLLNATTSIESTRQDSLAMVQDVNEVLVVEIEVASEHSNRSNISSSCTEVEQEVHSIAEKDIPSQDISPLISTNDDANTAHELCGSEVDRDDNTIVENIEIIGVPTSQVDALLEEAMLEAKERACAFEENHRIRRIQFDKRRKSIYLDRNARVLQRWFRRRIYVRNVFIASIISNLASVAVESIMDAALDQCVQLLETTNDSTNMLLFSRYTNFTRDFMSLGNEGQIIDFNYQYIMVIHDLVQFRLYIFILYHTRLVYLVVYLTKALDNLVGDLAALANGCSLTDIDSRLILQYAMNEFGSDLDRLSFPLLINAIDDSIGLHNPAVVLDDTTSADSRRQNKIVQSCSKICQVIQKALTRHAFHAIHRWKASIRIQSMCRGFLIRSRLDSFLCKSFDYVDNELDLSLFCDDIQFEVSESDSDSDWQPSRPTIEPMPQHAFENVHANVLTSPSVNRRNKKSEPHTVPHGREDTTPANLLQTQRSAQPREGKLKDWRVKLHAQAMLKKRSYMKLRGSNGRALSSRR